MNILRTFLSSNKLIFSILLLVIIARLITVFTMGLMPQDAYYYYYSTHPDWSYFDHPPMVAYLLWLFTTLFGKSVIVIKLASFITSLGSIIAFHFFSRQFLPQARSLSITLLIGVSLMFSILSMNATPDVPLILFWILSLLSLQKAVFKGDFKYWVLSGLMMGLAFDSKYTGILLPIGLIFFLFLSKEHRKYLFSKEIIATKIVYLATIFPVVYWNYSREWISFSFQSSRRAGSIMELQPQIKLFFGNIGTQMGLLSPVLFVLIIAVLGGFVFKHLKGLKMPKSNQLFLLCFSLPTLGGFMLVSLFYWVKLNWMMPGYFTAIIFLGYALHQKAIKAHYIIIGVLHILLLVQIVFYVVPVKSDDTWFGWKELAEDVQQLQDSHPTSFVFAYDDYKTSALLNFYLDQTVYAGNILGENALQFNMIQNDLSLLKGKDALFIDSDKRIKNLDKNDETPLLLNTYFEEVRQLKPIIIYHFGKPVRKFWVYECIDYKGVTK